MNTQKLIAFLSENTTLSSRRLIAYRSSMVILVFEAALIFAVCFQACNFRSVDNGLLVLAGTGLTAIAWLSKQIFYRPGENKTENQ